jgi:predicted amidohydrolase
MPRRIVVAAAQMGPVARDENRTHVVDRLIKMMRTAHDRGAKLVVFPELALTTFFPRWVLESEEEIDSFFETEMPNNATQPLFEVARQLGVGFHLGYAEIETDADGTRHHYNTAILVDPKGEIVGKYRKVHLPGYAEPQPDHPVQHLEKRYFEVGNLGFPAFRAMDGIMGMCICNDRRWPETYRVLGLQGAEIIMLGYNTPSANPFSATEPLHLGMFHNLLSMQAGAYQNGAWVVGAAKAGVEEGVHHMGGSCIIAPTGEIAAMATTEDDEVITAECDLDKGNYIRETIFNFAAHRRIEHYKLITEQTGVVPPPE